MNFLAYSILICTLILHAKAFGLVDFFTGMREKPMYKLSYFDIRGRGFYFQSPSAFFFI